MIAGRQRIFAGSSHQAVGQNRLFCRHWVSSLDLPLAGFRSGLGRDSAEPLLRPLLCSTYPEIISMKFPRLRSMVSSLMPICYRCSNIDLFIGISVLENEMRFDWFDRFWRLCQCRFRKSRYLFLRVLFWKFPRKNRDSLNLTVPFTYTEKSSLGKGSKPPANNLFRRSLTVDLERDASSRPGSGFTFGAH